MIEEIVRLITNAAPGIDKDLERILELIYEYGAKERRAGYRTGKHDWSEE